VFTWRTVDAELAALVDDSMMDAAAAGLRGSGEPLLLTFESVHVVIEVTVTGGATDRELVGQVAAGDATPFPVVPARLVEGDHVRHRLDVRYAQQRGDERAAPAGQERRGQAEHLIAALLDRPTSVARGHHGQRGHAGSLFQVIGGERPVDEPQVREERVVGTRVAMGGQVGDIDAADRSQDLPDRRLLAGVQLCPR
jgi:hypothetical protein